MEPAIYPYRSQIVRDLAWSCFSERLIHVDTLAPHADSIKDCHFTLTEGRKAWLNTLDADPTPLLEALGGQPPKRLGLYFEALWQFFLKQDPQTELIAHNLAIHDNGRTLGEFDCLYFDKDKERVIHLELAVKYFLAHRDAAKKSDEIRWYGPNSKDRLDLKLAHMLDRQINLGEHPAAQQRLGEMGIGALQKAIVFHGYLFNSYREPMPYPIGHNSAGQGGNWLPLRELPLARNSDGDGSFLNLPRQRWLSPAVASERDSVLSFEQLAQAMNTHFSGHNRPQLIARLDDNGEEATRFFVTSDLWPKTHAP